MHVSCPFGIVVRQFDLFVWPLDRWFGEWCPVDDLGFDAVAGDESPDFSVVEAGPDFAIGEVNEDGGVAIGQPALGGRPGDDGVVEAHRSISEMIASENFVFANVGLSLPV